jgi:transposase
LYNGELYTILTNKNAQDKKGSILAIVKRTKVREVLHILDKILVRKRYILKEVTLDMAGSVNLIAKKCFPKTEIVTVRFYVQKLALAAVQEESIRLRWEVIALDRDTKSERKWKYKQSGTSRQWRYAQTTTR